jgi:hypothetical protein
VTLTSTVMSRRMYTLVNPDDLSIP